MRVKHRCRISKTAQRISPKFVVLNSTSVLVSPNQTVIKTKKSYRKFTQLYFWTTNGLTKVLLIFSAENRSTKFRKMETFHFDGHVFHCAKARGSIRDRGSSFSTVKDKNFNLVHQLWTLERQRLFQSCHDHDLQNCLVYTKLHVINNIIIPFISQ